MSTFFTSILGANWRTSLFGLLQLVAGTAVNYIQSLTPGSAFDWKVFGSQVLIAALSLLSKDANVTGGTVQATGAGVLPSTTIPKP